MRANDQPPATSNSDIVDRLARLRSILPLIATDLAAARRRANTLEIENQRLTQRVAELETRQTTAQEPDHASGPASTFRG
jgi:hypothetical protein